MKTHATTPLLALALALALCASGCASKIQHVTPEKFKALYAAPNVTTMHSRAYIGHSYQAAYIEETRESIISSTQKVRLYYVYLHELDPAFLNEVLNSKQQAEPFVTHRTGIGLRANMNNNSGEALGTPPAPPPKPKTIFDEPQQQPLVAPGTTTIKY